MPRERAQQAMLQAASKPPTAPGFTTTAATPSFARTSGREAGPPCIHRSIGADKPCLLPSRHAARARLVATRQAICRQHWKDTVQSCPIALSMGTI